MDNVKKVVRTYELMKNEWSKKPRNLDLCEKYLSDIKVIYPKLGLIRI